mgnify:CR=1 FL=1
MEQTTIEHIEECESSFDTHKGEVRLWTYKTGWNGYEAPYEESVYLCDECHEAYLNGETEPS